MTSLLEKIINVMTIPKNLDFVNLCSQKKSSKLKVFLILSTILTIAIAQ